MALEFKKCFGFIFTFLFLFLFRFVLYYMKNCFCLLVHYISGGSGE